MRSSDARCRRRPGRGAGVFALAQLLLASGCGYTFAAAPGILNLTSGEAVQVAAFQNSSLEADAGIIARHAVARAVAERGATVTEKPGTLVLNGTVESVTAVPTGPGTWSVSARLRLALIDPARPERVLGHSMAQSSENYLSGDDVEASEVSRRLATTRLLERIAAAAVDSMVP